MTGFAAAETSSTGPVRRGARPGGPGTASWRGCRGCRCRVPVPRGQPTALGNVLAATQDTAGRAFDLHRADLLTALRMTPPGRHDAERTLNREWCDHWRQGIPLPATLHYISARTDSHPL